MGSQALTGPKRAACIPTDLRHLSGVSPSPRQCSSAADALRMDMSLVTGLEGVVAGTPMHQIFYVQQCMREVWKLHLSVPGDFCVCRAPRLCPIRRLTVGASS